MSQEFSLPVARFLQVETNISKAFHELKRLAEVSVSHGAALKELGAVVGKSASKLELSAAVASIKFNKLSVSIQGAEAEMEKWAEEEEGKGTKELSK